MDHLWTPWRMPYLRGEDKKGETLINNCVFCHKIDADDKVEHVLHRGEHCYVTLNLYPYNNGHLMVVPYRHISAYEDLTAEEAMELTELTKKAIAMLRVAYAPHGFNIGINQGAASGAGIEAHLHQHIVPRWAGDTNFMTVSGGTRVIPEWINETYDRLKQIWDELHG